MSIVTIGLKRPSGNGSLSGSHYMCRLSLVVDIVCLAFVNSVCGGSLVVDIVCLVLLTQSVT